ncbi:MAG: hypothetical protein AB1298_06045, partial [Bacteroidota bacterium]
MLEKIVNITAGSDYKQSSRPNRQTQAARYLSSYSSAANDSISFSPATALLHNLHWKLKRLKNDKEHFQITFEIDGFEFSTQIWQSEIINNKQLDYDIRRIAESYMNNIEIYLKIAAAINENGSEKIEVKYNLPALGKLTSGLVSLTTDYSSLSADNYKVSKMFSEFENDLRTEFEYLNNCLFSFVEKYSGLIINF